MSQVLILFDEATLRAIDRVAPAAKRKRADFTRRAVKDAIFREETERTREAYRLQPDSAEARKPGLECGLFAPTSCLAVYPRALHLRRLVHGRVSGSSK